MSPQAISGRGERKSKGRGGGATRPLLSHPATKENPVEELYSLSAGRWGIVVSKVEPGTLEHQQGARHAVTIYCDEKPIVGYAYTAIRRGEGACVEDMI